ncbi:MAG TPA: hypothetical protein VFS16_05305 [Acidimicrobiia bacterium]|nr:hypothetical protein [Acidimicrobiia bacterium]
MGRSRPGRRGWALAGVAGLVGGVVALVPLGPAADADTVRSVVAKATAQGVRAVYTIPDYVVVTQIFDGGGPVAQAEADSTGRAASFAALPYPGENAITAPGTLSVALGQSVPLAYPFYVKADHPSVPAAELADPSGSYGLSAKAQDGAATAVAALAGPTGVSGARSAGSALLDDGGIVRTVADSVITGISVGDGALRIASVTTRSETVLGPDDPEPVTTASLVIEGASVGGRAVTIDADGVHAADQAVEAPVGRGVDSENQFLGQLGITAKVVPAGVPGAADALVVTSTQTFPVPGNPKGTLVMTFGGAASEITVGSPDGPVLDAPSADAGPAPEPPGPAAAPPAGVAAAVPPDSSAFAADQLAVADPLSGLDAVLPAAGPPVPASSGPVPPPAGAESAAAPIGALPARGASRVVPQPDLGTTGALYSVLGFGGVALVVTTRLIRWRAVR